jgi:hypothetical protein
MPLADIARATGVEIATVYKYHQQWSKNPEIEKYVDYYKGLFNKSAPDRDKAIEISARLFGISPEQLETLLHQPSGLKRLLSGKVYFPVQTQAAHKRYVAFEMAILISDHLIKNGGKFEDVFLAFQHWMKKNRALREEEDQEIKQENEMILFMRRIMKADLEFERQGRVQPERISVEERETILKWGVQAAAKQKERIYWLRIGLAMAEGITREQARQKIYQDLLNSGDAEGAKRLRQFQDIVHPLKTDNQSPLSTTPTTPESSQ